MASSDILLGRGIVTVDGDDIGQCSRLVIRHSAKSVPVAVWDASTIGGSAEVAVRNRVFIDLEFVELHANNRAKLLPDDSSVALSWAGKNANAADCDASSWALSVPKLILLPAPAVPLINLGLENAPFQMSGEALRVGGETTFYALTAT